MVQQSQKKQLLLAAVAKVFRLHISTLVHIAAFIIAIKPLTMYFSYYEKGWGELYFQSVVYPFSLLFSEKIPELFIVGLN